MSTEAMKQALDALSYVMSHGAQVQIAKDILTQAIEQADKPVAWANSLDFNDDDQEIIPAKDKGKLGTSNYDIPLYTAPPPRKPLTKWQPIETAPKTGRKVILFYLNRNKLPRTVMARWLTDEEAAETDADDVGLEGGWYECIDNWDDYTEVAIHEGEPSHWMPLPAPPIEAAHGIGEKA